MTYQDVLKKIDSILKDTKVAVLATAGRGGLSCAQVCIVNDGSNVFFQTGGGFEKVKNIRENPYVALSCGNYNFKGLATVTGHPRENKDFIKKYSEKFPVAYKSFTDLPNEVLVRIVLTECKIWEIPENVSHKDERLITVNLTNGTIKSDILTKN